MASRSFLKSRCMTIVLVSLFLSGMAQAPPLVGGPAPVIELKTVKDQAFKLADLQGKFVVLNFWATWCVPCIKEMPEFQKIHQSSSENNIEVVAINFAESKKKVEKYIQGRNFTFPILLDRFGNISGKYKVRNLPVTYIITPDGIIREEIFGGGVTQKSIESRINKYKWR